LAWKGGKEGKDNIVPLGTSMILFKGVAMQLGKRDMKSQNRKAYLEAQRKIRKRVSRGKRNETNSNRLITVFPLGSRSNLNFPEIE